MNISSIVKKMRRFIKAIEKTIKRTIKKIKITLYSVFLYSVYLFTLIVPLKNIVLFESYFGRYYSDNPRAIYEHLQDKKIKTYFILNKGVIAPQGVNVIRRRTIKYYYYLYTAKIIVSNSRLPLNWKKKQQQIYIQTWHGTPLKKLVFDLDNIYSPTAKDIKSYHELFHKDVVKWDYLISSCPFTTDTFKRCFKYDNEILEIGYPRNHKLYNHNDADVKIIKESLGIRDEKKIILYAPTYREHQSYGVGKYYYKSELDFSKIISNDPDTVILVRYHYMITDIQDEFSENVINVSNYPDISDLYLVSDLLITDYSSVFFDYAILNKPFLFYTYDIDLYRDELRGFYFDMYTDFPTKPALTTDDLIKQINNIQNVDYKHFNSKFNPDVNSDCLENIYSVVLKLMK